MAVGSVDASFRHYLWSNRRRLGNRDGDELRTNKGGRQMAGRLRVRLLRLVALGSLASASLFVPASGQAAVVVGAGGGTPGTSLNFSLIGHNPLDRKSTRLNSSHQIISYAVFCL